MTEKTNEASKPLPKGGIIVSVLKTRLRAPWEGGGLHLGKLPGAAIFPRAIPPAHPRIPFEDRSPVPRPAGEPVAPAPTRHRRSRHGWIALLRSRRKGRQRIINFILLPLAILATATIVVWIVKFL